VNGKQFPSEGPSLGIDQEKISVMGYRKMFEGSAIRHSNSEHKITHDIVMRIRNAHLKI